MVLNVLLIIYAALTLVDMTFMLTLYLLHDRRSYYRTAMGVWVGIFLAFVADGALAAKGTNLNHIFGIPLISLTMYGLAKLGQDIYRLEIPFKNLARFSLITWIVGAVLHFAFQAPFALSSFVICLGSVAPVLVTSYKLFRSKNTLNIIDKLFGGILIAEGVHILDYPFLRNIDSAAVFGFSFGLLLIYFASMLIPVVINSRISADLNEVLEKKVQERTNELLEAKQALTNSAKMSALGEMAGGIAHEINNPLAIICSLSGQLTEVMDDETIDRSAVKEMALQVEKTSNRIAKIVQGLKTFSRDGAKDPFQPINVHQMIEDTLSFCAERFKRSGTKVTVRDFDKELHVEGRVTELSQVLLNLLNNAFDAISDIEEKWVEISVNEGHDCLDIAVTDCGPGVPVELRDKIFQPFFTTKEVGKGTGMGLSISAGIVRAHHGELRLDAKFRNTRFVIRIPKKHSVKQAA